MRRSDKVPAPGSFKYGSICCGLAWGKPPATIAKICNVTVRVVRAVQRRHKNPPKSA